MVAMFSWGPGARKSPGRHPSQRFRQILPRAGFGDHGHAESPTVAIEIARDQTGHRLLLGHRLIGCHGTWLISFHITSLTIVPSNFRSDPSTKLSTCPSDSRSAAPKIDSRPAKCRKACERRSVRPIAQAKTGEPRSSIEVKSGLVDEHLAVHGLPPSRRG
jgi:hypothetical protein